jgi:hypothetical protein
MTTTQTAHIGTRDGAVTAYLAYRGVGWAEVIGQGEDRTAYLVDGVVYKVGRRMTANPYDHGILTAWRAAGAPWAPESSLYAVADEYGEEWPVMAMPCLLDDGSTAEPAALATMHEQTGGQVDRGNYAVIKGQPIVLDGCTVAGYPC